MTVNRIPRCSTAAIVVWALAVGSFSLGGVEAGLSPKPDMQQEIDRIVARDTQPLVSPNGAGGVAVAVHLAGQNFFFNRGFARQDSQIPITSDSLFNIGSVRKVFEATLLAEGVLRGELSLDVPVNAYVPELTGQYIRRVTVGELATHTSGLLLPTDHPPWPDESYSLREFLATLNAWTPHAGETPGKQRIYTHAGYVLLQLALERRYRTPIGALIENRILKPLKMNSTLVPERGPDNRAIMSPQFMQRTVQGYSEDGKPIGPPGNQQSYYDFPGTGQMFSSARDLAILVAASLDEGSSDPQLREALQVTQREAIRINGQNAQAMAWEINDLGGPTIIDKPGGLNNASAYVGLVPQRKLGIVILCNRGDVYLHEIARRDLLPELAKL
jgi:beta-lactamase class C